MPAAAAATALHQSLKESEDSADSTNFSSGEDDFWDELSELSAEGEGEIVESTAAVDAATARHKHGVTTMSPRSRALATKTQSPTMGVSEVLTAARKPPTVVTIRQDSSLLRPTASSTNKSTEPVGTKRKGKRTAHRAKDRKKLAPTDEVN
jgi:hypothetical protein